jgi:hypothetical protein
MTPAFAWGPHPEITQAALDVLPNLEEVKARLGEENVRALLRHCWMPDHRGQDLGTYYADDYLLIPAMPYHISHVMPHVAAAFEPYFRRALQALRTETPANAARQIGPILHFVEDVGAPPHAKENCPHHGPLENWVKAELIKIPDYQPRLLGTTEDEAVQGLRERIKGLVAYSAERADRALALMPNREAIEPIILESALETARVTADLLYTLFTLGLREGEDQPGTCRLEVKITAPALRGNGDQSPRVVLVGTPYSTCAEGTAGSEDQPWQGVARLRNLPPGKYRLLVYRPGARPAEAEIELTANNAAEVAVELEPTEPAGNLVYNPDASLFALGAPEPDRWTSAPQQVGHVWRPAAVPLRPGSAYQVGIALRKLNGVRATCLVSVTPRGKPGTTHQVVLWPVEGKNAPEAVEVRVDPEMASASLTIQIFTAEPLQEVMQKVWVVLSP